MQNFGKVPASICAVLFVITGILALFLFNIEQTAFSARTYKQAFEKQQIYQRMPSILATALSSYVAGNQNADPFLKTMTQADWEKTIVQIMSPEELRTLTDTTVDSLFDYVNGKSDSAVLSLVPFKSNLAGPQGVEAVKLLLQAQPACTAEQLFQLGLGLLQGDVGLCNPPQQLIGAMTPLIESQLRVIVLAIPDNVSLVPAELSNIPGDPRIQLNRVRTLMKLSLIIPFLCLFGLTLFTMRNLSDWLKWTGISFMITGGISAFIALVSAPLMNVFLQGILQNRAAFLPAIFLSTFKETVGVISQQILAPVVVEGGLLTVAGIAMLLAVVYLSTRTRPVSLT